MGSTLDTMHYETGTKAVVEYLEKHGWACEKNERMGFTIARQPGVGIELLLPSPSRITGKISIGSRILPLLGE